MASKKKKFKFISRRAVERRREWVLELRLAGFSPTAIVEELSREKVFEHTTVTTVWNDINALKKNAKLEEIESAPIIKEIFQRSRVSNNVISRAGHRRFKQIADGLAEVQGLLTCVDEQARDEEDALSRRERLIELASKLRVEARAETRLILSINDNLLDMPKRLGILLERKEVGLDDGVLKKNERLIEVIRDERDQEKKEALIQAAELLATVVP